jgi:pyruvate, orthophosphate dikinase
MAGRASCNPVIAMLDGSCALAAGDIGGKAWGLNRMRRLGLPVPPAFVITQAEPYRLLGGDLWARIVEGVDAIGMETGRRFASLQAPLLLSVRSGTVVSMPGMMDTVLNLGMNREIERALAAASGLPDHAAQVHRRLRAQFRGIAPAAADDPLPDDPWKQLRQAITAVRSSWSSTRAVSYRRHRGLPEQGGTAVTVQAMVFGDLDSRSGSGVMCSRSPLTGDGRAWGEWATQRQGSDVVSGLHSPEPLASLRQVLPDAYAALVRAARLLEAETGQVQEIEFTIESGRLWLLQSRPARLAPEVAAHLTAGRPAGSAPDSGRSGKRGTESAAPLWRARGEAAGKPLAQGVCACPGQTTGLVVTDPGEACERAGNGEDVILARPVTSPADIEAMIAARAVITDIGGATSHAAVICREAGRPCVVGCGPDRATSLAGQLVTVDAASGHVWPATAGQQATGETPPAAASPRSPDHGIAGPADRGLSVDVLRMIGLKGAASAAALAAGLGSQEDAVMAAIHDLAGRGLCTRAGQRLQLSAQGQRSFAELFHQERASPGQQALETLYSRFSELDAEVKDVITGWQLRRQGTPTLEIEIPGALSAAHHDRVLPLLTDVMRLVPRFASYRTRLSAAADRLAASDHRYIAGLTVDSYHTIWFELHQDLLLLTGKSRTGDGR